MGYTAFQDCAHRGNAYSRDTSTTAAGSAHNHHIPSSAFRPAKDDSLGGAAHDGRIMLRAFRVRQAMHALAMNVILILAIAVASFATFSAALAQDRAGTSPSGEPVITASAPGLVRPNDMNTGGLLLPSKTDGYFVEAPRLSSDVDIDISGPIARVKVTQRFTNPTDGWVEGVYVFPLPEDSAVDTLKMRVGDRLIEGVIKPREEARQIYEQAKNEGRKASLLEQQRENVFTNEVANIGPGETVIVQIEYQQTVKQDGGTFSLRYPMVVAPRYSPQPIIQTVDFSKGQSGFGVTDPVPDREKLDAPVLDPRENAKINPVTLTVRLAAGFPIGTVEIPFHEMMSREQDGSIRILTLKNDSVPADRDFELIWKPKGDAPTAALFRENVDGQEYILAFVTPPAIAPGDLPKKNREAIFVIDNSGSMAGESMTQAKLALEDALKRLSPADLFNIVRFDDTQEKLFDAAAPADGEHIAVALNFVRGLEAEGGTEMLPALTMALADRNAGDTQHVRQVVFITDGAIGNEQQLFDAIAQNRGRSRVFTVGIGSAPNSFFMTRAAELGRGTSTHIGSLEQVKERMGAFFEKLENPVMTGLSAQSGRQGLGNGAKLSEVSPDPLPDLYLGEPVVLAAKASDAKGELAISGDYAGQPWQVTMDLAQATEGSGIGKLWARRKIASLEAQRSWGSEMEQINSEIEKIALEHHLVSSRTSLVAVDVKVSRPQGEDLNSAKIPLNLPSGWDAAKWFDDPAGESVPSPAPMQKAQADTQRFAMIAAEPDRAKAVAAATARKQQLTLPQTATAADRHIVIGLLLMLIALVWLRLRNRPARELFAPSGSGRP